MTTNKLISIWMCHNIIFVIIFYTNIIHCRLQHDCGSQNLNGCFCGKVYENKDTKYVVNCTDLNFKTVDMLKELPLETQMLIFTGNNIPVLPWNIFGDLNNLTNLKYIDMSNNKIHEIKGKSYHHVPNVETLILNHNNISVSDNDDDYKNYHHPRVFSNFINLKQLHLTNAFADNTDSTLADDLHDIFMNSGLTKLFKIHLEQNEIRSFKDQNLFCDLPSLRDLYLGDNFIPNLNFNIKCLKKLTYLDLQRNNISKLSQKDLDSFDKLAPPYRDKDSTLTLEISNNPFKCDSALKTIYVWMHQTNVSIRNKDNLTCYANKFGTKYILNLKSLGDHKHSKTSKAITVLLVVLVMILISLMSAYVYLSREKIKNKLGIIIDKVSRKVHYTTIESQDV